MILDLRLNLLLVNILSPQQEYLPYSSARISLIYTARHIIEIRENNNKYKNKYGYKYHRSKCRNCLAFIGKR